jgi:hypothetical protein
VEDTLVEFLERGATVETDLLAGVKAVLPPDVARTLGDIIPPPPSADEGTTGSSSAYAAEGMEEPPVVYTADAVLANQIGGCRARALAPGRLHVAVACAGVPRLQHRVAAALAASRHSGVAIVISRCHGSGG